MKYRVRCKSSLQLGDQIPNTAYIYFDYNPAVQTNTALTTVVEFTSVAEAFKSVLNIYPNPAQSIVNFFSDIPVLKLKIYNMLGSLEKEIQQPATPIHVEALPQGIHFLQFEYADGISTLKFVKE